LSKIPTSLFGRGTKLLGLASKVAMKEVTGRLKTWEDEAEKIKKKVELAQSVVKTLSELKGASMKVGQLLSLDLGDYLPPEIVKVLEQLHQKSTFLDFPKIESILRSELGEKFGDLHDISEIPIAAASIGQVHKATLHGRPVVLKVQYPGVAESIPSDLKILELILKQGSVLFNKSETDIGPFLNEVRDVLMKEADYENELRMHLLYREKFREKSYIVPEAYTEYSTGKVLTLEYIEGLSFAQWLESKPSLEVKDRIADLLMRLYLEELFHHGLVQTDPNPGNFLITANDEMALLDFGAVKEYDKSFVEGYRSLLLASSRNDSEEILKASFKLGFIDERESDEAKAIYLEMMNFLAEPFRSNEYFDFTDNTFFNRSRDLSWEMTKKCRYSPPPKDLLFLHRKLAGIFIFIKKLDVKIRLKDYWSYVEDA
jgi:aarF domain-containing kinase